MEYQSNAQIKFCKDCKFARGFHRFKIFDNGKYECLHSSSRVTVSDLYIVTGEGPDYDHSSCFYMRIASGKCGPEGKLWEPK